MGGVLILNSLGDATHVAQLEAALGSALAARDRPAWRLGTGEGNSVLAAVRRSGRKGAEAHSAEHVAWTAACEKLGLRVETLTRGSHGT